jgi:hypothetical protein
MTTATLTNDPILAAFIRPTRVTVKSAPRSAVPRAYAPDPAVLCAVAGAVFALAVNLLLIAGA